MIELDECPSENAIVGFMDGALSDLERARIEGTVQSANAAAKP